MTSVWLTKYTVTPAGLAEAMDAAAGREDAPLSLPPDEYARWLLRAAAQFDKSADGGPTHGDPFLSPSQTNPTAGTPEDAAAQLDMAGDLDRALKAREDEGEA